MKPILNYLRKKPEFYTQLKGIYGKTIGLYYFKELYLKKIGLWNGKKRVKLLEDKKANKIISENIMSGKPFMVARYGSTEFRNIFNDELENLCFYSGFFPNKKELLSKFREIYFEASKKIDYLCVWNYKNHFLKKRDLIRKFDKIRLLVSDIVFMQDQKWVKSLKGKKVLVIHPFKKTIESQYKKMDKLKILPKLKKLEVIKAVQTIAGNPAPRFKTWFDALDYMKKEIDKKDFDIALIGCGAYGLPLAAHVKQKGKQAIHVGGGLQLFFGIRGRRWDDLVKEDMGPYWIRPLEEDCLEEGKKIEGGCYW